MKNSISYKKFFLITSIILCGVMLISIFLASSFISAMDDYSEYLREYFLEARGSGAVLSEASTVNTPISEAQAFAFDIALIVMPIIGTVVTVTIVIIYTVCRAKAEQEDKRKLTQDYLSFLNAGIAFILMAFLEYTVGRSVTFFMGNIFERTLSGFIRWIIMFFGIRFIFMITQVVISRRNMKKRELMVRVIYSVASFTIFVFYTLLAIHYYAWANLTFTTILGFFVVPVCLIIFESFIIYFRISDKKSA